MRLLRTVFLALPVAVLLCLVVLWIFQRRIIYFPFGRLIPALEAGLTDVENVVVRTDDGLDLHAWFVPAHGGPARAVMLVLNGNAGNRSLRAPLAAALSRAGIAVLLLDYRGYGGNSGSPTESGLLSDALGALAYLRHRPDVGGLPIVVFGESLGSGVAVALATRQPIAGLLLRSPFTSLVDVGRYHYAFLPVSLLLRDRFDSLSQIARINCPLLVIAGDRDTVVPFELSGRLYRAAREPKRMIVIAGADHNDDVMLAGERLVIEVGHFVDELISLSASHRRVP